MKITFIGLTNIRGFKNNTIENLSPNINLFIGANNTGKSTILNSILHIQNPNTFSKEDITIGENTGLVYFRFLGTSPNFPIDDLADSDRIIRIELRHGTYDLKATLGVSKYNFQIPQSEPDNLIYPYLSKRKVVKYTTQINSQNTNAVIGNFQNLYAKIDRIITPQYKYNKKYIEACNSILGFEVSTLATIDGKEAVYFIDGDEKIPLSSMGEGVANIIGLITDLCVAKDKIFLIEELENDIHPKALKALLNLIIEHSDKNQFFISTHSNIVMKYLGGNVSTKIFNVTSEKSDSYRENLFVSNVTEVSQDPQERLQILEDLGYETFDFEIWKGWLFLEESSAEVLIREWFIKWYTPSLIGKLRTFSAGSLKQVEPKFEDFNKLFVYIHLEPTYKNRVWVIIDSGDEECKVIDSLKSKYTPSGWSANRFMQFSEHDFEKYYPKLFQKQVENVLHIVDKKQKREAKKDLLNEVKNWILNNQGTAKVAFKESANEVIEILKEIERVL
ncbi:ATP-dependent nuclease [Runella slithyformis]|uniref:Endonuclease GajA/Old nuclease/RecF-like AAA domain-containing protein n=1 Tax=Runella slithyformis (strain ATCC 29530 / DSM 19594 / LMG 11500 / NCIMB 11436 / LSU 4) TaxID=761193 RepID=A0A7U3ZLZ6_RUNSL|nr:ATP-binding protein [Runella slithyformis]AEI49669.1 hypothetical protein Runsl_3295 [Runella slithyformis DSM 19594]